MKKLFIIAALVLLSAINSQLSTASAQTTARESAWIAAAGEPTPPEVAPTAAAPLSAPVPYTPTTVDQILSMIGSPTNYAVEVYGTYAPKAPQHYGGGVLAVYNVNQYVGMGLGLDWLGNFSLVSGNVQLQAPFHPLPGTFPSLVISPFLLGGLATAYTGAGNFNGGAATVEDIGGYIRFGQAAGWHFNTGICWGQWTGVGPYDVKRYHAFAGIQHGI